MKRTIFRNTNKAILPEEERKGYELDMASTNKAGGVHPRKVDCII
jgi:hypothetical protein